MAFGARTARGSGNERTSDTSLVSAINGTVAVDSILFALFLTDNLQTTDGTSNNHSSVADTTGANTWTKLLEETETDGAAADGLCFSLWFTKVASQLTSSDTVTLTISANVTSKAARLVMTTVDAGNTVALQQVGFGHAASSASVSSMPSQEYLLLGIHCGENEDIAITVDADYTENGTPARSSTSGVEDSNVTLHVAERVATLTGDTYTITGEGINNLLTVLAAVKEVSTAQTLTGALFSKAPTFSTGSVASNYPLGGVLFQKAPTFSTGAITAGAVDLAGVLFAKAPTFSTGTITIVTLVSQKPNATTSNDGWDTAPLAGQAIHTYIASDDDDYITVTV